MFGEADIAARLIADKALLQPFLRASQIAANSDFRPYVDQNAERARFMTSRVDELLRLQRVTLLTDTSRQQHILEQHSWGRSTPLAVNAEQARALQVLFMNNLHLDRVGDISIPVLAYENAVSVSRLLYRCNPAMVEASWLGDAVWLSDISSVYGVPGLLTPFWTSLLDSSCFAQLPGQIQAAFRFFLAASERDDLAILREGSSIIDYNFDVPGFRNYRVLHMLAAYQRLDRPAAASLFMDRFNPGDKLGLEVLVLSAWLRSRAQPQD